MQNNNSVNMVILDDYQNFFDNDLDNHVSRRSQRPLASGAISCCISISFDHFFFKDNL